MTIKVIVEGCDLSSVWDHPSARVWTFECKCEPIHGTQVLDNTCEEATCPRCKIVVSRPKGRS